MARTNEVEKVKCGYCEYFGLVNVKNKTGNCLNKQAANYRSNVNMIEPRTCKSYNLAPIHCVVWRREQVRK